MKKLLGLFFLVISTLSYSGDNFNILDNTQASISGGSISGISPPIPVASGGTGAATLTGVMVGNGTSAVTTVTAPTGTLVGDTDTQNLSNKTITASPISGSTGSFTTLAASSTANITGITTIGTGAGQSLAILNSSAATFSDLRFQTNSLDRWTLEKTGTESGANAGGDLILYTYNDDGSYLGSPWFVTRSSLITTFNYPLKVGSGGSAGKAMCWKADGKTLGYCSSVVGAGGDCTCN